MTVQDAAATASWTPVPDAVWFALRQIIDPYVTVRLVVVGDPAPKKRPRLGANGNTRTPGATKAAEKRINDAFHQAVPGWDPEPDWTFGALVELRTRTGSLVDIDNGQKLIMDALNTTTDRRTGNRKQTGLWLDDIQVGTLFLRLVRGSASPETEVLLFRVADNGTRKTTVCACGTRFRAAGGKCSRCRKPGRSVTVDETIDESLERDKRRVFRYLAACMIGYDRAPSAAQVAINLGIGEHRVHTVIGALIDRGNLARERGKLKIVKPLGDVA